MTKAIIKLSTIGMACLVLQVQTVQAQDTSGSVDLRGKSPPPAMQGRTHSPYEALFKGISLTTEQQEKIHEINARHRPGMDSLRARLLQRLQDTTISPHERDSLQKIIRAGIERGSRPRPDSLNRLRRDSLMRTLPDSEQQAMRSRPGMMQRPMDRTMQRPMVLSEEHEKEILEVLTPEQQAIYKANKQEQLKRMETQLRGRQMRGR